MAFNIQEITLNDMEVFGNKGQINHDKRVLIIGLGGTGTDALLHTKNAILNRFELENHELPKNIELLSIDTDDTILNKRDGIASIAKQDHVALADTSIATNLSDKTKLPDYFKSWVHPALVAPQGAGSQGAGAIRQIGRYLLISNYQAVYSKISSKIDQIMVNAPTGTLIDIIILSGISGGTGSGTFIDMGYIVRKVCEDKVIPNLNKQITAYLFMPDANMFNPNVPDAAKEYIKVNGYAALKDLDYFMSIPEKQKVSSNPKAKKSYVFRQKYDFHTTIESEYAPFDSTYLISGQTDVMTPLPNGYQYAIDIASDSIVNFIAGIGKLDGHEVGAGASVATVDINGAAMKAATPHHMKPNGKKLLGIYDYKILGASMASLPVKDITDYIAGIFLKKIDMLKNQLPQQSDYDTFYRTIGLSAVFNNVLQKAGTINQGITGADLKSNPQNDITLSNNLKRYFDSVKTNLDTYVITEIEALDQRLFSTADGYFNDINKGPFFANRILADGNNGAIAKLSAAANALNVQSNNFAAAASNAEARAVAKKSEADSAAFGKTAKYNEYISIRIEWITNLVRAEIAKRLAFEINGKMPSFGDKKNLVEKVREKNKSIYDVYSLILETLAKKFNNGNNVVHAVKGKTNFVWNIVNIGEVEKVVSTAIDPAQLDNMMKDLLVDMLKKSNRWCDDTKTLYEFSNFISDKFQLVLATSMDDYLKHIPQDQLEKNISELAAKSEEHFPVNPDVTSYDMNIFNKVTVPLNAPIMEEAVKAHLKGMGITAPPQKSNLCERISWTRVSIGVPIFRYAYLLNDEEAYLKTPVEHRAGLHLYENEGVCGRDYPALLPEDFYVGTFSNIEERNREKKLGDMFDQANKFGLIGYDNHAAYVKVSSTDWCAEAMGEILAKYEIDKNDVYSKVKSLNQVVSCKNELGQILSGMDEKANFEYIFMPDCAKQADDNLTVEYARESFCRMPEAAAYLEKELKKITAIYDVIAEMDKIIADFGKEKDDIMVFANAFVFDVLKQQGLTYVYDSGAEVSELVNLTLVKNWRYEIYKIFNQAIRSAATPDINAKLNEAVKSTDAIKEVKEKLVNIYNSITKTEMVDLEMMDKTNNEYTNAKDFYNKMSLFINDEIQKYTSMGI